MELRQVIVDPAANLPLELVEFRLLPSLPLLALLHYLLFLSTVAVALQLMVVWDSNVALANAVRNTVLCGALNLRTVWNYGKSL